MENQIKVGDQNTQQIGQNPINQPVISSEKPKTNYLLIVGIVFICFVVFGVGGYFLGTKQLSTNNSVSDENLPELTTKPQASNTPIQDETANWKTYTNSLMNYSIKYPSTWFITDLTQGQQIEIYYQPDKTKSVGEILIEKVTATSYVNETQPDLITNTKTIGGIEAKCKTGKTDSMSKTWCFLKHGEIYISILTTKVQGQDVYNETLDQILSTFKITAPANTNIEN